MSGLRTKSSYEPNRTRAYSNDLRWRMVYQRLGLDLTFKTIANNLGVDISTVHRNVELFLRSGDVSKKSYEGNNVKKVTEELKYFLIHIVLGNPGIMLCEIQKEILSAYNTEIAESTICQTLHQLNFSRKKMCITAIQQDDLQRRYLQPRLLSTMPKCLFSLMKQAQIGEMLYVSMDMVGEEDLSCLRSC